MIPRPSSGGHDPYRSPGPAAEATAGAVLAHTTLLHPGEGDPDGTHHRGRPVDWAHVPRVNLLPQEVMDDRRFRRTRTVLGVVVAVVVVLCGVATLWAQGQVGSARAKLEVTRNETLALQQQQTQFAEVPKVSAELDAARAARERALGADVLWYRFLTDLAVNTPDGATLSSVAITMNGTAAAPAGAAGLSPAGLGSVRVSGDASRFTDVAAWLDSVARVNGLTGTTLQSAVRDDSGAGAGSRITYSGGAVISTSALSHRYDLKAS